MPAKHGLTVGEYTLLRVVGPKHAAHEPFNVFDECKTVVSRSIPQLASHDDILSAAHGLRSRGLFERVALRTFAMTDLGKDAWRRTVGEGFAKTLEGGAAYRASKKQRP